VSSLAKAVAKGIAFGVIKPRVSEGKDKVYQEILKHLTETTKQKEQ
jgi:hypothetical protein